MKNLTEDFDFWGLPVEEKEPARPTPGREMHDNKKKIFEADSFLERVNGRIGGLLIEFNNVKQEIETLHTGGGHGN